MPTRQAATWIVLAQLLCLLPLPAADDREMAKAISDIAPYRQGTNRDALAAVEQLVRTCQTPEQRRTIERELARLLDTDATLDAKQFVCRQLWVIGSETSVPALARLLGDDSTVEMACYALQGNTAVAAGQALRQALGRTQGKARVAIILALGQRRDAEATETLCRLALGEDAPAAEAAVVSLGRIAGKKAIETLAELRAKTDSRLRQVATDAYLRCAEELAQAGQGSEAEAIYLELLRSTETHNIRRAALVGLARLRPERATPLAVAALREPGTRSKQMAVAALRAMDGEQLIERLTAVFPGLEPEDQALVIGALEERGATARPLVTSAAASRNPQVRVAAWQALGLLGNADSVSLLVRALADGTSPEERKVAASTLRTLRGAGVDDTIIAAMPSVPPSLRVDLIQVLADRQATTAVPVLLNEAAAQDDATRKAAFKALGRLAGEQDLPAVVRLLTQLPGDTVRDEAEQAVLQVALKGADESKRADAVLTALSPDTSLAGRCSLLRVLGALANRKALEAMIAASDDANATVKDVAVRALANWPDASALETLAKISQATSNSVHRTLTLRGYIRLAGQVGTAPEMVQRYRQALNQARDPDEKKLVLAGLGNIADLEALELVTPLLAQEVVQLEAAQAAIQIGSQIFGAHREEVRAALNRVLATAKDASQRQAAAAVLRQIDELADYITAWQVAGPYLEKGKDYAALFDVTFPPEKADAQDVHWRTLPAGADPKQPWLLDLLKAIGGEQRVAYVRTAIHSDQARPARLELGTDDGVKAWFNGSLVHANNTARPMVPGSDKVEVGLRQGWNTLLLKITQNNLGWEFCARLCQRDGSRMEGVRVDCAQAGAH